VVVQDEAGESASTEIQVQVNGRISRLQVSVFSEIGHFAPGGTGRGPPAMSNEDAEPALGIQQTTPAVAISGVADKNTVLQVKRL